MQWKRTVIIDFVMYIATASLMLSKVVNCMCCEISVFEMPCLGWCNTVHQKYCVRLWRLEKKVTIVKLKNGTQMVAVTSTRTTSSDQSGWSKLI